MRLKVYGIIGAALTLMIPFFLMLNNQGHHLDTDQSLCPFKMLTGFPCPGCGITKSLVYLYEGDVWKSLEYHLFGLFTFFSCLMAILVLSAEIITRKEYFNNYLYSKRVAYVLAAALMTYHVVRLVYFVSSHDWDAILKESIWK
ncbi:DUF2752 domain-containing protein [Flavobacterium suncheonense]|uniref:DUF2752 domain-containing protein n=1 Tax=Flavobacterium suncheonense TaxID=350894 RepID=UPI003FA34F53